MNWIARTALGVVLGYAVGVALGIMVQFSWFERLSWGASLSSLLLSGIFTCLAAAVAGAVATVIAMPRSALAAAIIAALLILQTLALFLSGKLPNPWWFERIVTAALVISVLAGARLFLRISGSPTDLDSAVG